MMLFVFLIAGLIIGWLRGGGLSGLGGMRMRAPWLVLISAAAEIVRLVLPYYQPQLFPSLLPWIQIARYLPLFLFGILNVSRWQFWLVCLGVASNFAVICANGWNMPVSWSALPPTHPVAGYFIMEGSGGSVLWFLADIVPVMPGTAFASVGDMLLGVGVMLAVQHGMARYSIGRHARGSLVRIEGRNTIKAGRRGGAHAAPQRSLKVRKRQVSPRAAAQAAEAPAQTDMAPEPVKTQAAGRKPDLPLSKVEERREPPSAGGSAPSQASAPPALHKQAPAADREERIPVNTVEAEPVQEPVQESTKEPVKEPQKEDKKGPIQPESIKPVEETTEDIEFLPMTGPFPPEDEGQEVPIRLSPRLQTIAGMIDRWAIVADVGCDHGKLSAWLALNGAPRVIATDVSAKSLAKTKQLAKELGLQRVIQTRVGDGLKKLRPGEADVIVMAGIGGPTISGILEGGAAAAGAAMKLILQPMNAVGTVRRWLADNGFCIVDEQLAEEDGRIYQIIAAVPGSDGQPPLSLFDLEIGHLLIDRRHPLLPKLLKFKMSMIDGILSEIADNATPKAQARRSELIELRGRCEETLQWLAG